MLDAASVEALMRAFMLGTGRQAAPVAKLLGGAVDPAAEQASLQALALLGQHGRFARRWARRVEAAKPGFEDSRTLPPAAARPIMLSLLGGKAGSSDDALAHAVADALHRRGMKVHPFDLPRLEAFVRQHADSLGASALAWVNRNAVTEEGEEADPYFVVEKIDSSNWQQGWPSQKAAFIREQRRLDPAGARELVAGAFAGERAPVRLNLIKALSIGLSEADGPFLLSLAKDRAPSVREAAEHLLARLPGSEPSARWLKECLDRIKVETTGFLRRGRALSLGYPATIRPWQQQGWALEAFSRVGLDQLAAGLQMSVEDMAKAAKDAILGLAFAVLAVRERRLPLLASLSEGRSDLWPVLDHLDDAAVDTELAAALQASLVRPALWAELPNSAQWTRLYTSLRQPLGAPAFRSILASKAWRALPAAPEDTAGASTAQTLTALAALVPSSDRAAYRAELRALSPALTGRANQGLALLDLIDTA